ncbi:MAG: hypothetical protein AAFY54_18275 [Cyanobacteria bacterium J06648_10]
MISLNASNFSHPSATPVLDRQHSFDWLKGHVISSLNAFFSRHFTEIDQAFVVWSALTLFMFSLGQFSTLSWTTQAILDAGLTGIGIATTSGLTWAIACQAKLRWVVLLWAMLMAAGSLITAYGIFCGHALILLNLCPLWLGLCAVGYGAMAAGMKSRCFTAAFWVHLSAMLFLSHTASYQFFTSGLVIALTLFFFSIVPWDREEP